MPFAKGQSGNPAGRPAGSPNKFTSEMRDAMEHCGPALIQRLMELAAEGNMGAMRQCLDRLMGKHRPSSVQLPSPESPNYVMEALTEIHRALGAGEIASDEAARLIDVVGRTARVLASKAVAEIDFADRLERCEQAIVALLNAGKPAAAPEPAIVNNNAETMTGAAKEEARSAGAPAAAAPIVKNNENTMAARPAGASATAATGKDVAPRPPVPKAA